MMPLSETLKTTMNTFPGQGQPLPMQQPGSINADGKSIINFSTESLSSQSPLSKSSDSTAQQNKSSQKTEQDQLTDKEQFTLALGQACVALKHYGKTPADLRTMRDMFLAVLSDVPVAQITKALYVHLNISDEIPTPKQLRDIIHPPKQRLSGAVYLELKKRLREGVTYVDRDEKAYCAAYEAQELAKMAGGSDELREYKKIFELSYDDSN